MRLTITDPSGQEPIIEPRRHFAVEGTIDHDKPLAGDLVLTVCVIDSAGNQVRYARQDRKDNRNLWLSCPQLVSYPKGMDDDHEKLLAYGFPPLLVKDPNHPEASIHDATIKCWYSDTTFKAVIITATDRAHGLVFDDGMAYTDEAGRPYTALPKGTYTIRVTLAKKQGEILAETQKPFSIGSFSDVAINRFNPPSHRSRMNAWCEQHHIHVLNDLVPGYLNPYLGVWYYHMGLLVMYRAGDVTQYLEGHVHLFVYLMDRTSTSYATELGYLESQGVVEDPRRLTAYHYDIGEAFISGRKGTIMAFPADSYLWICRIDLVGPAARENRLELDGSGIIRSQFDKNHLAVPAGSPFAVVGVVRPWQLDPEGFHLQRSNTYRMDDEIEQVVYTFDDGERRWSEKRSLGLERFDHESIGSSALEFSNLFTLPDEERGKTICLSVQAVTRRGRTHSGAVENITLTVTAG